MKKRTNDKSFGCLLLINKKIHWTVRRLMCFSMQTRVCLFVENAFSRRFFKSNWIWLFITARTQRFNILFLVASIYLFWRQSFRFTFFVALDLCVIAVRRKQIDSIEGDDLLHSNKRRLGLHTVSEWCWVPNAQAKSARFSFSLKCNLRFKREMMKRNCSCWCCCCHWQ